MYRMLQIDGGGAKGIIPAMICAEIERLTGRHIWQDFNVIIGTSTGAIIGGCLAAGVPAHRIVDVYSNKIEKLFKPRPWFNPLNWGKEKYDRKPFIDELRGQIGSVTMGSLYTGFIATAYGLSADRTHFLKSFDARDKDRSVVDVISLSALSAALYFGKINDPKYQWEHLTPAGRWKNYIGESFQDGGQGLFDCTIVSALIEILAKDMDDTGAYLLSLGCGDADNYTPFSDTSNDGQVRQVLSYFGQARKESSIQQVLAGTFVSSKRPTIRFQRINAEIKRKEDVLDGVKFLAGYKVCAQSLIDSQAVYDALKGVLIG